MDKIKEFFREINGGLLYGSQAKLCADLGIESSLANVYAKGIRKPSENHLKKMKEKYNKTEKELKDIFNIKEKPSVYQTSHNNMGRISQTVNHADIEFFRSGLKAIEVRMDLIIELLRQKNKYEH